MVKKMWAIFLALVMSIGPVWSAAGESPSGVFTGEAQGFGGTVKAEVTLAEGIITGLTLIGDAETQGIGSLALEQLPTTILEKGDLQVDVVAGASITSRAAIQAVQAALDQAFGVTHDPIAYTPGTYTAIVAGHNSDFEIYVTFTENAIESIEIGPNEENHSVGDRAMWDIRDTILKNQSLNVDAVAGATVTSRGFLAAVSDAVVQAGANPSALQAPIQADDNPTPQDENVDVVVVGGGGAGLAATIEAYQQGLDVILIEQLGILGGASGRAGYIIAGGTKVQEAQNIDFSVEDLLDYYQATDEKTVAFEKQTSLDVDWLVDMGVEFGPINLDIQLYGPDGARLGGFLTEGMRNYMDENGVDYRLNTRGDQLITNDEGRVIGVVAQAPNGQFYNIYADAVVLATGGYFANAQMTEEYFPGFGENPFDCGIGADGSGMLMAQDVGAELVNMDYANFHAIAGYYRGASRSLTLIAGNGGIAVNEKGERFYNEAGDYTMFTEAAAQQNRVIAIFDQTIADLDVIQGDVGCAATWGMYTLCDTLEEVADTFQIDYDGLVATVEEYAQAVSTGQDPLGKGVNYMRTDLSNPPYYVVETLIENHTTYGGINTLDNTQVLDSDGQVIDGLYAAGECSNKKTYMIGNLGAALFEGREAIRTFISQQP